MLDYDIKSMYEDMELLLIKSMKRNLKRHLKEEEELGFEFPQWQALKLKELKRYQRQNKDIVNSEVKGFSSEISQHLKSEFKEGSKNALKQYKAKMGSSYKANKQLNNSFFKINDKRVSSLIKTVNNDLSEGNKAVLRMTNDQYRQVIHKSAMYVANGVYTPTQAIDMANKDFLRRGLNVIEYKDGRRVNIASYSEMAVRTAGLRATLMGEGEFRKEYKQPLVRVTTHGTACPLCQDWQGKILIDDVYGGGSKEDGNYLLLSQAMGEGFLHPNCRHGLTSYFPEIEDISESYKDGKDGSESDAQYQADLNYINLKIKEYTRLEAGSLDKGNIKEYRNKRKEWQSKKDQLKESIDFKGFVEAKTISEAITYAEEKLGTMINMYKGLDLKVANELNKTMTYYQNNYPEVMENIRCLGNYQEINKAKKDTMYYYYRQDMLKKFPNASRYEINEYAKKLASLYVGRVKGTTTAVSYSKMDLKELEMYKGIYINQNFGKKYDEFVEVLKGAVKIKYHPVGTDSVKAVIDHEMGHQMDTLLGIREEKNIQDLFDSRTKAQITEELSEYSWKNKNKNRYAEMIAEGWAEYLNNPNPRPMAKEIGETIERKYAEWKKKNSSKK